MPIDTSVQPPPVKRGPGRPKGSANAAKTATTINEVRQEKYGKVLGELASIGVAVLSVAGQDADAGAIQIHAPAAIPVYAELATEIDGFGAFLDTFDKAGGKYVKMAMVTLPLVLQLAANHGFVKMAPGGMFNIQPPELLRAQMMAAKANAAREAQRQLKDAQEEAQKLIDGLSEDAPAA